jgi:hypothetical protein
MNPDLLREIRDELVASGKSSIRAWMIKEELLAKHGIDYDESTIRGKFIEMNEPLSGRVTPSNSPPTPPTPKVPLVKALSKKLEIKKTATKIIDALKGYIPNPNEFIGYIERPVDKRLALHYDSSRMHNWKYPLTQGKQGTGKTMSHMYYAYKNQLPFFLFSCFEDFKLSKLFGEKTILGGDVKFKEGMLTQAIQGPCVILFDEVNYVSNENSVDFHAVLQNRVFFVKDANDGAGKTYKLHDECRIGFAQNPKSAKYIGGNIKPSNFLGRCTYISYPEFKKSDLKKAIATRFPNLVPDDVDKFTHFYFACCETIDKANIPVDISIRQLNNVIDLYNHGMPLREALEDGLISIMDAASQPKNKEAFTVLAEGVWKEMMNKSIDNKVGNMNSFLQSWRKK